MDNSIYKFQIIAEDGTFIFPKSHLQEIVQSFPAMNSDYKIISIVGSQSSGKSTLFNSVFSTDFKVLDASEGMKQTTKGVWGATIPSDKLFIMDVEGVDSAERWEDGAFFEKSTTLFSLANSHLLIINLWTQDVGRFSGSNLKLLQTIFEINFRLFYKNNSKGEDSSDTSQNQLNKKGLLIILRDYSTLQNLEIIKSTILARIQKIWQEIQKPEKFADSNYDAFFHIQFETMAHYYFERPKFDQQAQELHKKFTDLALPECYFNSLQDQGKVPIPFESLDLYMRNIWSIIRKCKDLDLPSQRVLIAEYRCNQIKNDVLKEVTIPGLHKLDRELTGKIYSKLKDDCEHLVKQSLDKYDKQTGFYFEEVVQKYRDDLVEILKDKLGIFSKRQITMIRMYIKSQLEEGMQFLQKVLQQNPTTFEKRLKTLKNELIIEARDMLKQSDIPFLDSVMDKIVQEVETEINQELDKFYQKELNEFTSSFFKKEIEKPLYEKITALLNDASIIFWEEFNKFFSDFWKKLANVFDKTLNEGFALPNSERETKAQDLKEETQNFIKEKISDRKNYFIEYIHKIFAHHFKKENGKDREWSDYPEKDIERFYNKAMSFTCRAVDSFKNLEILEHKIQSSQPGAQDALVVEDPDFRNLFSESECEEYKNLLEQYTLPMFEFAKSQSKSGWLPKMPSLSTLTSMKNFLK